MISTWACLASALPHIPSIHPHLITAKEHLSLAVYYAEEYDKTWHSIFWNTSNTATKRRVREQLNNLAYDCYTHFLSCADYLSLYADEMDDKGMPVVRWWGEVNISLLLAHDSMNKENRFEIYQRQLRLI